MAKGKRWTPEENRLLREMMEKGISPDDIFESGKLPNRTRKAIEVQASRLGSFETQKDKNFETQKIVPIDIISLEEVLKRWSDAYKKICELESVSKEELERFRIIFMAASKYADLLADYHQYAEVEKRLERIERVLEELQKNRAGKD